MRRPTSSSDMAQTAREIDSVDRAVYRAIAQTPTPALDTTT